MFIGQSLICSSGEGSYVYGPWIPRQSDAVTFVAEVLLKGGAFTLDIDLQHKNSEDADSAATDLGSFTSITATGTTTKSVSGLKELVRYRYSPTATTETWIHMRMNAPIWQPN